MTEILERISSDIVVAMKEGDRLKTTVLRMTPIHSGRRPVRIWPKKRAWRAK